MTTNELRAKFEATISSIDPKTFRQCFSLETDSNGDYKDEAINGLWTGFLLGRASRDAEVEALRKDAERWRNLVAENNKGLHGKFRICWLDPLREGFITTDGVSCNGKDEEAIVRVFDAAMREESK